MNNKLVKYTGPRVSSEVNILEIKFDSYVLPHEIAYWKRFRTHSPRQCADQTCVIHSPTNHHMRRWPLNYRMDRGITERICPCGVGHPDPDDKNTDTTHGCCGCCKPPEKK